MQKPKYFRNLLKSKLTDEKSKNVYFRKLQAARISAEIFDFRKKRNMTQEQLAKKIKTSQPTIARLEDGDYSRYSLQTLNRIAEAMDLELFISFREREIKPVTKNIVKYKGNLGVILEDPYNFKYIKTKERKAEVG